MRIHWLKAGIFLLAVGLVGCRSQVAINTETAPEDTTTRLGDNLDLSLADWLKLSRAEQAKLVAEWSETVANQRQTARDNLEVAQLLPQLRPPIVSLVFAQAKYSEQAGFSLPPYLKEGDKDFAIALHLARYGDSEAALKLIGADDKEQRAKIDACAYARSYPAEWTRLVGLLLQNAELKLANGETDGATELVGLHRQLRSVLDEKALAGPLGAALLPRGRHALQLAAEAWRQPRWNKTTLASDIDAALAEWGAVPDTKPSLAIGAARQRVTNLLHAKEEGCAVVVKEPLAVQRALDLLDLPLPNEGANSVVAFLNDKQTLTEWLVVYRPKLNELFPQPRQLAYSLVERGYVGEVSAAAPGIARQKWTGDGRTYEVAILTRGSIGGALVRVAATEANATPSFSRDPRDFGVVNLDRSFEQNRLGLAPNQNGTSVAIKDAAKLAKIDQPAAAYPLADAVLQRESKEDLLARLKLQWPVDQNANALNQLALPFWAAYGPARLESTEEATGSTYLLTWKNETTQVQLQLPFDDKAPVLVAQDSRGAEGIKQRLEAAAQRDSKERQERLARNSPRTRLSRSVQLPSHGIDNLRLGMTREQVQAVLPGARSLRVRPLSDGLNVLILNEPPPSVTYWPRQLFIRFGEGDRVAEIRVRYQEGPHAPGPHSPTLLETLKAKPNGAPDTLPAPWAGLWTDLSLRKQPTFYRWLDDQTCLTYQRDQGGSEVALRDCPPDRPCGVELAPLLFCSRGVEGCELGALQSEVRRRWNVTNPLIASNGAEVLTMPANNSYDVLLVWYEKGQVSRVIARYRDPKSPKLEEVAGLMQQTWAGDIDRLGFVRRRDSLSGQIMQSYYWNDDRTRVRLFAQETEAGIRLFTEWRSWPIPTPSVVSK